jgi:steroid delta-isomerase-like uncharacterized protein
MATIDNAAILRELYEASDNKDEARVASYAHPDARVTNVAFGASMSYRDYMQNWATAFPDGKRETVNMIAQGNLVVCEFIGKGTQAGPLEGPGGTIPPSNRRLEMRFVEIWEFRNGKIAAGRMYFDSASFMNQLGLGAQVPTQGQRPARGTQPRH